MFKKTCPIKYRFNHETKILNFNLSKFCGDCGSSNALKSTSSSSTR